jgi:hypothetical protein
MEENSIEYYYYSSNMVDPYFSLYIHLSNLFNKLNLQSREITKDDAINRIITSPNVCKDNDTLRNSVPTKDERNSMILAVNNNTGIVTSFAMFRYTKYLKENLIYLDLLCSSGGGGGNNLLNLLKELAFVIKDNGLDISGILLQPIDYKVERYYINRGFKNRHGYYFWDISDISIVGGRKKRSKKHVKKHVKKYSKKYSKNKYSKQKSYKKVNRNY